MISKQGSSLLELIIVGAIGIKPIFARIFYLLIVSSPLNVFWNFNLLWISVSGPLSLFVTEGMQL